MANKSLEGMHILITRPEAQAVLWAKQLHELGAKVTLQPMLAIRPVDDNEAKQAIINTILRLDEYQKAIFVSQNAVEYGIDWIDQYWPQLPAKINLLAVGSSTATLLNEKINQLGGVDSSHTINFPEQAMNSEALLALPILQAVDGEKILIFRGCGGRTYLGKSLEARGALVDYCELYRRLIPDAIDSAKITQFKKSTQLPVTAVHSGETLHNLCTAIQANDLLWIKQQALLVPGERVAQLAKDLHFENIIIAKNATHESMIEALHDWQKR